MTARPPATVIELRPGRPVRRQLTPSRARRECDPVVRPDRPTAGEELADWAVGLVLALVFVGFCAVAWALGAPG